MTTFSIRDRNSSGSSAIAFSTSFSNSALDRRGGRATAASPHATRKSRLKFSVVTRATSSTETPFTSARRAAVRGR